MHLRDASGNLTIDHWAIPLTLFERRLLDALLLGCFVGQYVTIKVLPDWRGIAIVAGSWVAFGLLGWILPRYYARRLGRVTLGAATIRLEKRLDKRPPVVEVEWRDLAGYDDTDKRFVQLVPVRGARYRDGRNVLALELTVPTPNEFVRTEVLAILDEHGLSRVNE